MPKIIIPNTDLLPLIQSGKMDVGLSKTTIELEDTGPVSDGFHSFEELYKHRCLLYCLILQTISPKMHEVLNPWKSWKHEDGSLFSGWFITGFNLPYAPGDKGGSISYHLPADLWEVCYAEILECAPKWDGHTSQDVVERISTYLDRLSLKGDTHENHS